MKKMLSVALIALMIFGLMLPLMASAESAGTSMWVNCADGKRLNLRTEPKAGSKIIDRIDCGKQVEILNRVNKDWAFVRVTATGAQGYVMTKFLVASKPGKYQITERDDNFRSVTPYRVEMKARSKNADDSVCLRVQPNKSAQSIRRFMAGEQVTVVAVGKTWSKVVDPVTGATGYVANDYIRRV